MGLGKGPSDPQIDWIVMICRCRFCNQVYSEDKSRADYKGYCSQRCLHKKAKELGFRKQSDRTEYDVLKKAKEIGSVLA